MNNDERQPMPPRTALVLAVAAAFSLMTLACSKPQSDVPVTGSNQSAAGTATPSTAPTNTAAPPTSAPPTPQLAPADRDFVASAASGGQLEVEASKLALERSKSEATKKFAKHMVEDHSKVADELRAVATAAGYGDFPATLNAEHAAQLEKLRALQGREFDREFAAQIGVAAHTETIAVFERGARDAGNGSIRTFADGHLPDLHEHLTMAQSLAKSVGVPAARLAEANKAGDALRNADSAAAAPPATDTSAASSSATSTAGADAASSTATSASPAAGASTAQSSGKNAYEAAPGANTGGGREATPQPGQQTPPGAFGGSTGNPNGSGPSNSNAGGSAKK